MSATEVDELVHLYQRTATQLSQVRTRVPDPVLVGQLSRDVAAARSAVAGSRSTSWADVGRFVTETFPAAVYRTAGWWAPTAFAGLLVAFGLATWIATHPSVQQALLPPGAARDLTRHAFASYYHAAPAVSFAAQVWTNNAWIAAGSLILGVLLGVPTLLLLTLNMVNLGAVAGYLVADHRAAEFFGLVLPHGLLELTAVFIACGSGLRLGWTVIDPGPRRRTDALAAEGRRAGALAIGLTGMLLLSGAIEAFVTPSGLPTAARVGIGAVVEAGFLGYVITFGGRAVRAGVTGDLVAWS